MIPGELFPAEGTIELNAGLETVELDVSNTGDRPIQVGSHYHFAETNEGLSFDREKARGMQSGRDVWYHDEAGRVSDQCDPVEMNAEDPLFILYTSGSTGQPKGVLHTTGGYLVYASMPIQHKDEIHPGFAPFLAPAPPLLVTIFDPADVPRPSEKILSAAFGLTERESLLVQQLVLGSSLREAADTLQISYNTARNHLASATSKTGARSQADIVRRGVQVLAKLGETEAGQIQGP